jgi:hypothetical protein
VSPGPAGPEGQGVLAPAGPEGQGALAAPVVSAGHDRRSQLRALDDRGDLYGRKAPVAAPSHGFCLAVGLRRQLVHEGQTGVHVGAQPVHGKANDV